MVELGSAAGIPWLEAEWEPVAFLLGLMNSVQRWVILWKFPVVLWGRGQEYCWCVQWESAELLSLGEEA